MKMATLLLIALSNQGYWLGGQEQTIRLNWNVKEAMPQAVLLWQLRADTVVLAKGQVQMPAGNEPTVIKLQLPQVRVRTDVQWVYQVTATDGGKELTSGSETIHLFPNQILNGFARRLQEKKLAVLDKPEGLPAVLTKAKIPFTQLKDLDGLQAEKFDLILVGTDQLDESAILQAPLLAQAQGGAQVLIMEQKKAKPLGPYNLAQRAKPSHLKWRLDHPLLQGVSEQDCNSWLADDQEDCWALQLPADEPALEIAYWPREVAGETPVPIDALLAVKSTGSGRIIFCQLPLKDWQNDPRGRIFLENALDYLLTRPQPTPRPSERPTTRPVEKLTKGGIL